MISLKSCLPKTFSLFLFAVLLLGSSCEKEHGRLILTQNDTLSFSGTFKRLDSHSDLGTISLRTAENFYDCHTSLPYGYGAGTLLVNESTIDFVDTVILLMPAIYGPVYVLNGKYNYHFDGKILSIRTTGGSGTLVYELRLE